MRTDRRASFRRRSRTVGTLLAAVLTTVRASWVDPDTPFFRKRTQALTQGDDRIYRLIFSDEFELDGRTFHDGHDPRWTALQKNDYTNEALHYYSHDNARTEDGMLKITTEHKKNKYRAFNEKTKKFYADTKHIQSAMLQGWNKFCFTGGIVEFSAKLPGEAHAGGLWPALWMLGNLARATFVGSSDFVWPFSYNRCDPARRLSQEVNACAKVNHYGMTPFRGRGAPEIDIIESMQGEVEKLPNTNITRPYQSASLQIAPGIPRGRPILGKLPRQGHWYEGMEYSHTNTSRSELNPFFYGVTLVHKPKQYTYQADALSANLQLTSNYYETQHLYRVEWDPPEEDGTGGYIRWYTDNVFIYGIEGTSLNLTGAEIPSEPMYLIMNTAVSRNWGFPIPCPEGCDCSCIECGNPDCECGLPTGYCDNIPASFDIDYVRVYQAVNEAKHIQGCSPVDRPTELFIKGHERRYKMKGQRHPLKPIQSGGGLCDTHSDCGSSDMGFCGKGGTCSCHEGRTGPHCLAHDGYYTNESRDVERPTLHVDGVHVPMGMVVIFACLLIGMAVTVSVTLKKRATRRHRNYKSFKNINKLSIRDAERIHSYGSIANQHFSNGNGSDITGSHSVTYCVIDPRLVDQ